MGGWGGPTLLSCEGGGAAYCHLPALDALSPPPPIDPLVAEPSPPLIDPQVAEPSSPH